MNTQIQQEFADYLVAAQISQRRASEQLGYSPAVVGLYLKGTYSGNIAELEAKIINWLKREAQRHNNLIIPEQIVTATRNINEACTIAHASRTISVIVGPAGSGKTTALQHYANTQTNVHLVEVDQSFTLSVLAQNVAQALHLSSEGVTADLTTRIVDRLSNMDSLFIFDECDYLTSRTLEWIRRVIHDKAHCGVVLTGLPKLEYELRSSKNVHDQLISRVGFFHRVRNPGNKDQCKILNAVWNLDSPIQDTILKHSPNYRTLANIMSRAWLIAQRKQQQSPDLEAFEEATASLMTQ